MKVACHCIANDNGHCVAETCHGEIRMLDAKLGTPESRREHYDFAVKAFSDYFGEGYEDDDLDE